MVFVRAHAVYDVIAGWTYARLARESGWDVNAELAAATTATTATMATVATLTGGRGRE